MEKWVELDAVGMLAGSDKSSMWRQSHDYLRHYEYMFTHLRDRPINLVEVGVMTGRSLKAWKWFFPRATIVGIDILERCRKLAEDRIVIEIGSQADTKFIRRVCVDYPPTIFVDDGSHLAEHNIVTFEAAFPRLAPGGFYVVEDLHGHFGGGAPTHQTENIRDAPGYFISLARRRLARRRDDMPCPVPQAIQDTIDSVTYISGAVIIRKMDAEYDVASALATIEEYSGSHAIDAEARCRLAAYLLKHRGPVARALAEIEAAIASDGSTPEMELVRAEALLATGDLAAAEVALDKAVAEGPEIPRFRQKASMLGEQIKRERAPTT